MERPKRPSHIIEIHQAIAGICDPCHGRLLLFRFLIASLPDLFIGKVHHHMYPSLTILFIDY